MSQDALEVMGVTYSLTHSHTESLSIDFTEVTLVSEDTDDQDDHHYYAHLIFVTTITAAGCVKVLS